MNTLMKKWEKIRQMFLKLIRYVITEHFLSRINLLHLILIGIFSCVVLLVETREWLDFKLIGTEAKTSCLKNYGLLNYLLFTDNENSILPLVKPVILYSNGNKLSATLQKWIIKNLSLSALKCQILWLVMLKWWVARKVWIKASLKKTSSKYQKYNLHA